MSKSGRYQIFYDKVTSFVNKRKKELVLLELIQYGIYAIIYLLAWTDPTLFSPDFISALEILILLDFVLVHSGIFMSIGKFAPLFFFPFYFLFVFILNYAVPGNTLIYIYCYTVFNRLLIGFGTYRKKANHPIIRSFFRCFVFCFSFAGAIMISPILPDFGLTEIVQEQIKASMSRKSSGDITLKMMMICGFINYILLICLEYYLEQKSKDSINIMIIGNNKIGAILKSKFINFWDFCYQINRTEDVDLKKFDEKYDFLIKKEKSNFNDISEEVELIIITEQSTDVNLLEKHIEANNIEPIPILDLSNVFESLDVDIIEEYDKRIPEKFLEIPNNQHPIRASHYTRIYDDYIKPAIWNYEEWEELFSPLNPVLYQKALKKMDFPH